MRRVIGALVLASLALALPAGADQWSRTYAVSGEADLWMKVGDGNVRIEGWDRQEIQVSLETVGYTINKDFTLVEGQQGGRVGIELKFPERRWNLGAGQRSIDFTVKVPRAARLDIGTADGHVGVAGVKGDITLHTGDGPIETSDLDGRLKASTGDGHIRVAGRFDALDLHTGDGSVEAAAAPGSEVDAEWRITTGDGRVTVRLPDGLKANLSADSGDGDISVDVPLTMTGEVHRSHVRGTLNGGGGPLAIRTGDGSIRIEKY